jgi:hypothetical protein
VSVWSIRVTAGAVFGLYMAHLLYFLNPQIEIAPVRLVLVSATYAAIAGAVFGTLLWLIHRARRKFRPSEEAVAPASGVGFLAVAAFLAAVVYWGHLALLRVYLPRSAVQTLSKASTIVAAAALVLFLLWLLDRTVARRASTSHLFLLGCLLVMVSWFFLSERRTRYRVETIPAAVTVQPQGRPRPVLVVAIRDLPFDWVVQLGGEDLLPFFSRVPEQTFFTRVEPFPTTSPKTLWASLATGKLPHAHGVTGRFSYQTPLTAGDERLLLVPYWVGFKAWGLIPPVRRISAQLPAGDALALWTVYERLGNRTVVINWPSSSGASASGALRIDDRAIREAVRPSLSVAIPRTRAIYQSLEQQTRSQVLAALAADQHATSLFLEAIRSHPDIPLRVLSLNGLAETSRALGIEGNRLPAPSTRAGEVARSYVEHLDHFLAQIERAAPEATLLVVSPSGPRPPHLPATPLELAAQLVPQEPPGSADGYLMIRGPDVIGRDKPRPASVTDMVPSVLFAAGLPLARDMDGRTVAEAFTEAFVQQNPMSLIATYEAAHQSRPTP